MKEWLKTLAGSICALMILLNLIPDGKFVKYVRFYAGLLFFLMTVSPVLQFFGSEGELERLLQLEFLKEDYDSLETAVEGMGELKNDQIQTAYRQELRRQIGEIAEAYGVPGAEVEIVFSQEDGYTPVRVMLAVDGNPSASSGTFAEAAQEIRDEIASVYGLVPNRIFITGVGGEQM